MKELNRLEYLTNVSETINAKEARISEGAKIINMAFANKPALKVAV